MASHGTGGQEDLVSWLDGLDDVAGFTHALGPQGELTDLGWVQDDASPTLVHQHAPAPAASVAGTDVSASLALDPGSVDGDVKPERAQDTFVLDPKQLSALGQDELMQLLSHPEVSMVPHPGSGSGSVSIGSPALSGAAPASPFLSSLTSSPLHPSAVPQHVTIKSEASSSPSLSDPKPSAESAKAKRMERKRKRGIGAVSSQSQDGISTERLEELKASELLDPEVADSVLDRYDLTPEEERWVKRQRRLVKNRLSAQQSRERKKAQVDDLTDRLNATEQRRLDLERELNAVKQHNMQLQHQVQHLSQLCREHGVAVSDAMYASVGAGARNLINPTTTVQKVRTGAITLCMVVFAFGLLASDSPVVPSSLPTSGAGGRLLLSVGMDMDELELAGGAASNLRTLPSGRVLDAPSTTVKSASATVRLIDDDDDPTDDSLYAPYADAAASASTSKTAAPAASKSRAPAVKPGHAMSADEFVAHSKRASHPDTYIFSTDVRRVQPHARAKNATTTLEAQDHNGSAAQGVTLTEKQMCMPGEVVAVVVPADTLNATSIDGSRYPEGSFVELHAEVLTRQTFHGVEGRATTTSASSAAPERASDASPAPLARATAA